MTTPAAPDMDAAATAAPGHAPLAAEPACQVLDTCDGLERIMGDRALYLKLLWRFKHDYQNFHPPFSHMISAELYGAARLKAHTLKGAAGMIGARAVHLLASELETALRAQAPATALPLARMEQALLQLLAAIDLQLPHQHDEPARAGTVAAAAVQAPDAADPATLALIGRLAYFLQEGDGAAIDVLESSASVLAATLGVATYQDVAAAAHEFDFDTALLALRQRR